jgi:hypothetical protein
MREQVMYRCPRRERERGRARVYDAGTRDAGCVQKICQAGAWRGKDEEDVEGGGFGGGRWRGKRRERRDTRGDGEGGEKNRPVFHVQRKRGLIQSKLGWRVHALTEAGDVNVLVSQDLRVAWRVVVVAMVVSVVARAACRFPVAPSRSSLFIPAPLMRQQEQL